MNHDEGGEITAITKVLVTIDMTEMGNVTTVTAVI